MIRFTSSSRALGLVLIFAGPAAADCVPDSEEIGDIGPGSSRICEMLESRFPGADSRIGDREIHSAESVTVVVSLDGRMRYLDYRLIGPDWVLKTPQVADRREQLN